MIRRDQARMTSIRTLLVAAALPFLAQAETATVAGDKDEMLDHVEVHGARPDLSQMRQAVIEAEDRFYEKYNELNPNDEFYVKCRVEARTGTRLATRTCRPVYQEDAVHDGARQAVELRQKFQSHGGSAQLGSNSPPVSAAVAINARRPEFERNMRSVVLAHPELIVLLQERADAIEALEKATRRDENSTEDF